MRMITTAGAHACGKTAVILKTAEMLMKEGIRTGVMKLDCISSEDDQLYRACGIPNIKYISGNVCMKLSPPRSTRIFFRNPSPSPISSMKKYR